MFNCKHTTACFVQLKKASMMTLSQAINANQNKRANAFSAYISRNKIKLAESKEQANKNCPQSILHSLLHPLLQKSVPNHTRASADLTTELLLLIN